MEHICIKLHFICLWYHLQNFWYAMQNVYKKKMVVKHMCAVFIPTNQKPQLILLKAKLT